MINREYLERLEARGRAKRARIAITTALKFAVDALESSEAGLHFTGELCQLLGDPSVQEPNNSSLSVQVGDQLVEVIVAQDAAISQNLHLGHLADGNGGAEIICHGASPELVSHHVITISAGVSA